MVKEKEKGGLEEHPGCVSDSNSPLQSAQVP
jgi:hypothetical protein